MYYTRYRPQKFSEISKPNDAVESLLNQLKTGNTSHAYLFIGPRGTGKTTVARLLAKSLNCLSNKHGEPCGLCENCFSIQNASFVDLLEIDAASNRGIDDIRALRERVKLLPVNGKKKVYIIDEVHMLTTEAFNALLKTLEEPPQHVVFVLCTTEDHKVPETIKSRCQVHRFKRATLSQIIEKLTYICKSEGVEVFKTQEECEKSKKPKKILEGQLASIAKASRGGFRDAETMLEQIVEGGVSTSTTEVDVIDLVAGLVNKDMYQSLSLLREMIQVGADLSAITSELIYYFRALLFSKAGVKETDELNNDELDVASRLIAYSELVNYLEVLSTAANNIKTYPIPELALEIAITKLCTGATNDTTLANQTPKADDGGKFSGKGPVKISTSINTDSTDDISLDFLKQVAKSEEEVVLEEKCMPNNSEIVESIVLKWDEIVKDASKINNSISALLKSSKPIYFAQGELTLEVTYKFHKERLENSKNRELVEVAIRSFFDVVSRVRCVLSEKKPATRNKFETGELTDHNISPVGSTTVQVTSENLLGIFDGGLPM